MIYFRRVYIPVVFGTSRDLAKQRPCNNPRYWVHDHDLTFVLSVLFGEEYLRQILVCFTSCPYAQKNGTSFCVHRISKEVVEAHHTMYSQSESGTAERLSALRAGRALPPKGIFPVLISLKRLSQLQGHSAAKTIGLICWVQ
jgi:hypothetical protein